MWEGTILLEDSNFQVRNKTCRVSDDRKCDLEGGIVFHLTLLVITDYFSQIICLIIRYSCKIWKWPTLETMYTAQWKINNIFDIIASVLVLYPRYKTINQQIESTNIIIYKLNQSQFQSHKIVCFCTFFLLWHNVFAMWRQKRVMWCEMHISQRSVSQWL